MRFRAAVLNRVNEPMTLDTLTMAPLEGGDVLVRIHASGLCHTDLEVMQGSLAYPLPIVLGHEGAAVVEGREAHRALELRRRGPAPRLPVDRERIPRGPREARRAHHAAHHARRHQ
jgi:hypothetical protein